MTAHRFAGVRGFIVSAAATTAVAIGGCAAATEVGDLTVSPLEGPTSGGTVLTVTGGNIQGQVENIFFGLVPADSIYTEGPSTLKVIAPAHPAGVVDVTVIASSAAQFVVPQAFKFVEPPTVSNFSPSFGALSGGTSVTVTGSGFRAGATVMFGATAATELTISPTSIVASSPAGSAGQVNVVVSNVDSQAVTLVNAFTYQGPPNITSIAPAVGSSVGGTPLGITGTGLVGVQQVSIGGAAASNVSVASATRVTAVAPPGGVGTRDLIVLRSDGAADTLVNAFSYVAAPPPSVVRLTRDAGSTAGGALLYVQGSNFVNVSTVTIGGSAAAVTFVNSSNLRVVAPAHAVGKVDVTVSQPGGNATLSQSFEYLPAPTIVYSAHDFEDGAFGAFAKSGDVTVANWGPGYAVSGIRSVRARIAGAATGAGKLEFSYTNPKQPALTNTGVYQRWYVRMDSITMWAANQRGQIKLLLSRSESNPPSWLHVGYGPDFPGPSGRVKVLLDYNTGRPPNGQEDTGFSPTADVWFEIQTHYLRSGGVGRARMWINGKLVTDVTDANFGTDSPTPIMTWAFAIDYTQNTFGVPFLTLFIDDPKAANGFIDPI